MTIKDLLVWAAAQLPQARHEAEWLASHYCGVPKNRLLLEGDKPVAPERQQQLQAAVDRRKAGEPLQYILGEQPFMDFTVKVTPDVLIPRWDSEVVVEKALSLLPEGQPLRLADVCTGSGALALALKYYRPQASVIATDVSEEALAVAKANSLALGLDMTLAQGDLLEPLTGRFHLILSNPPYIPTFQLWLLDGDVLQEPRLALDGGIDGLEFYHRLAMEGPDKLYPGGWLVVEIGSGQGEDVAAMFREGGLQAVEFGWDYGGNQRYVVGRKA